MLASVALIILVSTCAWLEGLGRLLAYNDAGTESETVPLITQPGVTSELTCPDSKTYFTHNGDPTTAQYYVNNKGVPKEKACSWNKDGSHEGNWAPVYFGVGRDIYEKTWLSISSTKQNNPTDYQPLDYDVEIVGDNLSGKCKYCNGQYCSGNNYENCNTEGCTVSSKVMHYSLHSLLIYV